MIAEAITIDGSLAMSATTLIAVIGIAIKVTLVLARIQGSAESNAKAVRIALAKIAVMEENAQNHRHDDVTRFQTVELRLAGIERDLGIPGAQIHGDVTPRVHTPIIRVRTIPPGDSTEEG